MKTIWIVRHAERIDHANASWTETAERPWDPHITEVGQSQAWETGKQIRDHGGVDVIISSPFLRCLETASIISQRLKNVPVYVDLALSEYMVPKYFSKLPTFLDYHDMSQVCSSFDPSYRSSDTIIFPETSIHFVKRMKRVIKRVEKMEQFQRVLLVTHGYGVGVLANILEPSLNVRKAEYCCLSRFVKEDNSKKPYKVELLSDVSHWKKKLNCIDSSSDDT